MSKKRGQQIRRRPPNAAAASAPMSPMRQATRWLETAGVPRRPPTADQWHSQVAADPELARALRAAMHGVHKPPEDASPEELDAYERQVAAFVEQRCAALWATPERALLGYRDAEDARFVHAWLPWWAEHAPPAQRLLDIGAGAGLLACGYAALRPEMEVVAVEPHPAAAAVTSALAHRLGVADRVRPSRGGLSDLDTAALGGTVDQVVITRVLANQRGLWPRDIIGDAVDAPAAVRAGWSSQAAEAVAALLAPSVAALTDGGVLLLAERVHDAGELAVLAAGMQIAGAAVDLVDSGVQSGAVPDGADAVRMVRLVGRRGKEPIDAAALLAWAQAAPRNDRLPDIDAEHPRARLTSPPLWWAEIRYPESTGGGVHRVEIIPDGQSGWVWQATSKRMRELLRLPVGALAEAVARWRDQVGQMTTAGSCVVVTSDDGLQSGSTIAPA
ncbi:hypothetical protein SAMN04488107_0055 [Geodermatophilus saharensis]|uniref:Methyltransferase domain-containing protein n=1 Tax=Geodermatophilus saharensis TaxID=1137994 RepID=A0A238ZFZ0_9ACTN|nr:class I SAM-dependent methyltransferase [Geodermatophilus saharensis]SNR82257.1 hypothetical protein SAMN04488107_0055 [Geodermatophilus saharensis]